MKHGRGISFTVYPMPATKALLVKAAHDRKRAVSNFLLYEAVKSVAAAKGKTIQELLPHVEYESLVLQKRAPKRRG